MGVGRDRVPSKGGSLVAFGDDNLKLLDGTTEYMFFRVRTRHKVMENGIFLSAAAEMRAC